MLISHTWEEERLELLVEIAIIVANTHEAVLDDVGHNHFCLFVHLSTFIVWIIEKCYISNEEIFIFFVVN